MATLLDELDIASLLEASLLDTALLELIALLLDITTMLLALIMLDSADELLSTTVDEELAAIDDSELCEDALSLLGPGVATQAESEKATASKLSRLC